MFRSLIEEIRGIAEAGRWKADRQRSRKQAATRSMRQAGKMSVLDINPDDYEPGDVPPQKRLRGKKLR